MITGRRTILGVAIASAVGAVVTAAGRGGAVPSTRPALASADWPAYGGDLANTKYARLDQIGPGNAGQLRVAWRWASPDAAVLAADPALTTWLNEATPVAVAGTLYTSTSLSQVAAVDAATGTTRWTYDSGTYRDGTPPNYGFVHRGVAVWTDPATGQRRVLIGTGDARLIAVDAAIGRPVPTFGTAGQVDLTLSLGRPVDRALYGVTSPPLVIGDVVVVGSSILDFPAATPMPPGDVRAFDVRTGRLLWTFHAIPTADDPAAIATWQDGSLANAGAANAWSILSGDPALGYVYLPLGSPAGDHFGGDRPGDDWYGNCLVCVEAATGRRVWHRQLVRHDLWDYDLPAAPNLVDLVVDGHPVAAVAQVTKQGYCFVFDRATGRPVWPIRDEPAPRSTVAGERPAAAQPVPTRPPPFDRQGLGPDDLIDFTPALHRRAAALLEGATVGPLFTPPARGVGTVQLPGIFGGASWAGAAFDPVSHRLFVSSVTLPFQVSLASVVRADGQPVTASHDLPNVPGRRRPVAGPAGLPICKPPYGRITALDLDAGTIAWAVPLGQGPTDAPELRDLHLPPLGWPRRGHLLVTPTLLFAAQEGPTHDARVSPRLNALQVTVSADAPALLAVDKATGRTLASVPLPSNASGALMSYAAHGKQYVVVPVGGAGRPAELVAVALP